MKMIFRKRVIEIMGIVDKRLASDIAERNGFTI